MKNDIVKILEKKPEYTRELIILFGVIELCKVLDVQSFETVVKSFEIKSDHWWSMITQVTEEDDFINLIDGELYETVLELQMWLGTHEHDIIKGSMLYNLVKNGIIKNTNLKKGL